MFYAKVFIRSLTQFHYKQQLLKRGIQSRKKAIHSPFLAPTSTENHVHTCMHPFAFLPVKFKTESSTHKLLICSTAVAQKVASISGNQQRLAQNSSCCICGNEVAGECIPGQHSYEMVKDQSTALANVSGLRKFWHHKVIGKMFQALGEPTLN